MKRSAIISALPFVPLLTLALGCQATIPASAPAADAPSSLGPKGPEREFKNKSTHAPQLPCEDGLLLNEERNACSLGGVVPRRFRIPAETRAEWRGVVAEGKSLWMLEALDSTKKELADSGFLPDHTGPGWGPYTGSRKEIWAAYHRDAVLAEGWTARLNAVIEAREPDAVATIGALALLGHLHYALATKLFDSQPTDAQGDSARAWGQELRAELNRLAPTYIGSFSEALELAHQANDIETERLVSRRLYDIHEELEGLPSLLPEEAKQARSLVTEFESCDAWTSTSDMDFVPENLVQAPDDPQKTFTLRQATEGLNGRGALVARLSTDLGEIRCALFHEEAPYSVANFVGLARGLRSFKDPSTGNWGKRRAYDGVIFHRVIRGFMAQGGDPSGTGRGDPGYMIPNEQSPSLIFNRRGLLAGAHRGRDTGGMQFFITDAAAPHLNGGYTIFGLCDDSPVLDALMSVPTGKLDRPQQPPVIQSVTIGPQFSCEAARPQ